MEDIMKHNFKQLIVSMISVILIATMLCGTVFGATTNNEDGDVIENPWEDLFEHEKQDYEDLVLEFEKEYGKDSLPKKAEIKSATKASVRATKAKIIVKKQSGVKGYQVKYSTNKKFKKSKTLVFAKNKFTIKKLKSGKKYFVKVRCFKVYKNKRIYGAWSSRKAILVRKNKIKSYKSKNISVPGIYSKKIGQNSYKKIISSYKQLEKVKKYVNKNYNSPQKYLKNLNKYSKSFFDKNVLIFVTENVDMNAKTYKMSSLQKNDNTVFVNVKRRSTLKEGQAIATYIKPYANTYFISLKKSSVKKIKKIKVVYK